MQDDPFTVIEDMGQATSAGPVQRWFLGVGLAVLLGGYATTCVIRRQAIFVQDRPFRLIELQGEQAVAVGALYLSVAVFMHCHWFWTVHPVYHGWAQLGKIAALFGVAGSVAYWVYLFI